MAALLFAGSRTGTYRTTPLRLRYIWLACAICAAFSQSWNVSTVAGGWGVGSPGYSNGIGSAVSFFSPEGLAFTAASGMLFVADYHNNVIRQMLVSSGNVTTLAGGGSVGGTLRGNTNGVGTAALFNDPIGLAVDSTGSHVFVAEYTNNLIRSVVISSGTVTTLAGGGSAGGVAIGHSDGMGTAATFYKTIGLASDTSGNLYVSDSWNHLIRKVVVSSGAVSRVAGGGSAGGVASGHADGAGTTAMFFYPAGIAIDATALSLYVVDWENNLVRRVVLSSATVTTLAGGGSAGGTAGGHANGVGTAATFYLPFWIAADTIGNLFVSDPDNNLVRKIAISSATVSVLAGGGSVGSTFSGYTDGIGTFATLNSPLGLAIGSNGTLYVADSGNNRLRLVFTGNASVSTITGSNVASQGVSYGHVDGVGTSVSFLGPTTLAVDAAGDLFVADYANNLIRSISLSSNEVITVAGGGSAGGVSSGHADGIGTAATFSNPYGLALGTTGTILFVSDFGNNLIRQVSPLSLAVGTVSLLAGGGSVAGTAAGHANGIGTVATFNAPYGITVDSLGNLFVADESNHLIRKVVIASATVTTLAGGGSVGGVASGRADGAGTSATFYYPIGVSADSSGNLYVADYYNHLIRKIVVSSGSVTTLAGSGTAGNADGIGTAAAFNFPMNVAVDTGSNLYIADTDNNVVRKIVLSSITVTTIAGGGSTGGTAVGFSDGVGTAAKFNALHGLCTDGNGLIYAADYSNNLIRKVAAIASPTVTATASCTVSASNSGTPSQTLSVSATSSITASVSCSPSFGGVTESWIVTRIAGGWEAGAAGFSDGIGTAVSFSGPSFMVFDAVGENFFVADSGNNVIRQMSATSSSVSTLVGGGSLGGTLRGSSNGVGTVALFDTPVGLAIDSLGDNLFIADYANNLVRRVLVSTGAVTTLAGGGSAGGTASGHADGLGTAATFYLLYGLSVDASGSFLFVADAYNHLVRKIVTATGAVTTIAGGGSAGGITAGYADGVGTSALFYFPWGIAIDSSAVDLYVADYENSLIRRVVISSGTVTTLAGGAGTTVAGFADGVGTAATFFFPQGIALDLSGNIFVADTDNNVIRKIVIFSGVVDTVVGGGGAGNTAPGYIDGTGTVATLNYPIGLAVDSGGNVFVVDCGNNRVRFISVSNGSITTVTGPDSYVPGVGRGHSNGVGTSATFFNPSGVAVGKSGDLFIADTFNNLIRRIDVSTGTVSTLAGGGVGHADGVGTVATFSHPFDVVLSTTGAILFVSDNGNNVIRQIAVSNGSVSLLVGGGSVAGTAAGHANGVGTASTFYFPSGVAVDSLGNLFVVDQYNHAIRKVVIASATVSSLAGGVTSGYTDGVGTVASFFFPIGVTTDSSGNVYVSDTYNHAIRKIIVGTGLVTTLAGSGTAGHADGTGIAASFNYPGGVSIDANGNIFVADTRNNLLRKVVASTAAVTSIAGGGGIGSVSSGATDGIGRAAKFTALYGLATNGTGVVYIADYGNQIVRRVAIIASPSFTATASPSISSTSSISPSATMSESISFSTSSTASSSMSESETETLSGSFSTTSTPSTSASTTSSQSATICASTSVTETALPSATKTTSNSMSITASSSQTASPSAPIKIFFDTTGISLPLSDSQPPAQVLVSLSEPCAAPTCTTTCSASAASNLSFVFYQGADPMHYSLEELPQYGACGACPFAIVECLATSSDGTLLGDASLSLSRVPTRWPLFSQCWVMLFNGLLQQTSTRASFNATAESLTACRGPSQCDSLSQYLAIDRVLSIESSEVEKPLSQSTPFSLLLTGSTLIVLVSSTRYLPAYTTETTITVGGVNCTVLFLSEDGSRIYIRTPRYEDVCASVTSTTTPVECGYQVMSLANPDDISSSPAAAGVNVECPPFCPGILPDTVPYRESKSAPLAPAILSGTGIPILVELLSTMPVGAYFTALCIGDGFTDPRSGACTNISDPTFELCAFGAGDSCVPCPVNAMCPGGSRAWPLPGYYTPAESSGMIVACNFPAASRCTGWSATLGATQCGPGYLQGSYACESCMRGNYLAVSGDCVQCPSASSSWDIVFPLLMVLAALVCACILVWCIVSVVAWIVGGSTRGSTKRLLDMLVYLLVLLQLISQVSQAIPSGLVPMLAPLQSLLAAVQLQNVALPSACLLTTPPFLVDTLGFAIILCIHGTTAVSAYCASARRNRSIFSEHTATQRKFKLNMCGIHTPSVSTMVASLFLVLTLVYPRMVNATLTLVNCTSITVPATRIAGLNGGPQLLRLRGVDSSSPTLLSVSILVANPSYVCYSGAHLSAVVLGWLVLIFYVVSYPIWTLVWVFFLRRDGGRHLKPSLEQPYTDTNTIHTINDSSDSAVALAAHFNAGVYNPSRFYFRHIDFASMFLLGLLLVFWQSPSTITSAVGRTVCTCGLLLFVVLLLYSLKPYPREDGWKLHLRAASILLTALASVLQSVVISQRTDSAKDAPSSVLVVALAYLFAVSATLVLVVLVFAVGYSMIHGARMDRNAFWLEAQRQRVLSASRAAAVFTVSRLPKKDSSAGTSRVQQMGEVASPVTKAKISSSDFSPNLEFSSSSPVLGNSDLAEYFPSQTRRSDVTPTASAMGYCLRRVPLRSARHTFANTPFVLPPLDPVVESPQVPHFHDILVADSQGLAKPIGATQADNLPGIEIDPRAATEERREVKITLENVAVMDLAPSSTSSDFVQAEIETPGCTTVGFSHDAQLLPAALCSDLNQVQRLVDAVPDPDSISSLPLDILPATSESNGRPDILPGVLAPPSAILQYLATESIVIAEALTVRQHQERSHYYAGNNSESETLRYLAAAVTHTVCQSNGGEKEKNDVASARPRVSAVSSYLSR